MAPARPTRGRESNNQLGSQSHYRAQTIAYRSTFVVSLTPSVSLHFLKIDASVNIVGGSTMMVSIFAPCGWILSVLATFNLLVSPALGQVAAAQDSSHIQVPLEQNWEIDRIADDLPALQRKTFTRRPASECDPSWIKCIPD